MNNSHKFVGILALSVCLGGAQRGEALELPPGAILNGRAAPVIEGDLVQSKDQGVRLEVPVPAGTGRFIVRARRGKGGINVLSVKDTAGKETALWINTTGGGVGGKEYPDTKLSFNGKYGWMSYSVRPDAGIYRADEAVKRLPEWLARPGASEVTYTLELRWNGKTEYELWINGQLLQVLDYTGVPEKFIWVANKTDDARLSSLRMEPAVASADDVAVPVEQFARAGSLKSARVSLDKPVPASLAEVAGSSRTGIEVAGLGTIKGIGSGDLQSLFWARSAMNNLDEQRLFTVPQAIYDKAQVLCVSSPEPGKVSQFTLRVTRYGGSRGTAMADSLVRVPDANASDTPEARRVGWVTTGEGTTQRRLPLWLIDVPIRNGDIADIFQEEHKGKFHSYLDVELLDPLQNAEAFQAFPPNLEIANRSWRPTDKDGTAAFGVNQPPATSNVTVFGLAMHKSPARLDLKANTGFQVFYASDKPAFVGSVTADAPGAYQVAWEIADVDGKIVERGNKALSVTTAGTSNVSIPVTQGTGWYAVRCTLRRGSALLWDQRTSFVMLPPDTRKAGYESPFFGWWFGANHGSDVQLDEVGSLLQRAGIRRADIQGDMPETATSKYGFTASTVGFAYVGGAKAMNDYRDGKLTLKEAVAVHEAYIREHLEKWPHIDRMLVFHESGARGAPFPSELWGVPALQPVAAVDPNSPTALLQQQGATFGPASESARAEYEKNWPKRIEYLTAMAEMVREKFPQLKMQYGNDGNSMAIMGELFRRKFPRKYIDTISIEDLGQTMSPERWKLGSLHSAWFLRELARKTGYGDVPITACPEWIGRETEKLGHRQQAEWKARDGLLSLAYGFDTISIAGINDASDGYYYSIWGNGGLCERYPTMAPKPSYAAIATLTRVLDQAKFTRFVPTGSPVANLQEYKKGNEWVYAFWTPRGQRAMELEFTASEARTLEDTYGRSSTMRGAKVSVTAGTGVRYLTSATQLKSVTLGASAFPQVEVPKNPVTTIALESATQLTPVDNPYFEGASRRDPFWWMPQYKQGKFNVTEVVDPEMGKCLEIELVPEGNIRDIDVEYRYFKFPQPIPIEAGNAGIWVKGNGGSGQVELWTGGGSPWPTRTMIHYGWPGIGTTNFDGWNMMQQPHFDWKWTPEAKTQIMGLYVDIPRKNLVGTELEPAKSLKIRVKSALVY
jgi:hypothetical protein